jgi:hypothetical protein
MAKRHFAAAAAEAANKDDVADDVDTPFRHTIPSGHSAFTVLVPQHYIKSEIPRRFYFKYLEIMPDFFSLEAEKLALDADPQLNKIYERDVQVRIHYKDPKTAYGPTFKHQAVAFNTVNFIKHINKHFESNKPLFAHTTPFFVDWIDKVLEQNEASKDYVPLQTLVYYNEEYSESKHLNHLPESVRELDGANNFLPPVSGSMIDKELYGKRIRLRLWLAPFTVAVFSNVNLWTKHLGFEVEAFGKKKYNQYHVVNDTAYWLPKIVAEYAPNYELGVYPFELTLRASEETNLSRIKHLALVQSDWLDNTTLAAALSEAVKQSSRSFNTVFSLNYNATTKTFAFTFPDDSEAVEVGIVCEPEFSHRLGFGYSTLITRGMTAKPQKERHSVKDAHLSALAVVYDTGPIICQLDQVSSNTTSGSTDKTVASLYPHHSGSLKMPRVSCSCLQQQHHASHTFSLWVNTQSTGAYYPVTFRLKRIYDDGSCSDFAWTSDANVYGSLQASCCPPSRV